MSISISAQSNLVVMQSTHSSLTRRQSRKQIVASVVVGIFKFNYLVAKKERHNHEKLNSSCSFRFIPSNNPSFPLAEHKNERRRKRKKKTSQ